MDHSSSTQNTASNTSRPFSKLDGPDGNPGDNIQSQPPQKQSSTTAKRELGLFQKYPHDPSSGPWNSKEGEANEVAVDIVAIHGLGANGSTWVWKFPEGSKNSTSEPGQGDRVNRDECDWLRDLDMLPDWIPNSRIFFFEWNANFENYASADILLGHADTLLQDLHRIRNPIARRADTQTNYNNRPIIFLASCFGGLLLIKALQRASERNSRYKNILDQTVGVSFMGVPFLGSHATLHDTCHLRVSLALHMGAEANGYLVGYLLQKNNELDEIVQRFCEMVDYDELRFPINCFYETHRANYKDAMRKVYENVQDNDKVSEKNKLPEELEKALNDAMDSDLTMVVVDRQSACLQGKERFGLDVQHAGMKRFPGPTDQNFLKVAYQLREMANNAGIVLQRKERAASQRVSPTEKARSIGRLLSSLDNSSRHNYLVSQRVPGTGNWFLNSEKFNAWVKAEIRILSCPGLAGSGKTIMTSFIVDHLLKKFQNNTMVKVSYIYCQYDLADDQDALALIKDLLKQLLLQCRTPPLSILSLYEKDEEELQRLGPQEILKAITTIAGTCSRIVIVVDAVDECKDGGRQFLSYLSDLVKRIPESFQCTVSLLLTSRSDHNVRGHFSESRRLKIRATNDDINIYLEGRMTSVLPDFAIENQQLLHEIKATIANAADGMFLLAYHYLDSLTDKLTENAIHEALRSFVAPRERSDIDRMADLGRVYSGLIDRINKQQPGFQDLARKVLSWTTFARRPLTLEETLEGLSVKPGQRELHAGDRYRIHDIISACTGLITIDKETDTIRLSHRSAHEFLKEHISLVGNSRGSGPSKIDVQAAQVQAQREIAQACVTYLCFDAFKDGPAETWGKAAERFRTHKLLGYAAVNWGLHARAGQMDEDCSVQELLRERAIATSASQAMLYELDQHQHPRKTPLMGIRMHQALGSGPGAYGSGLHLASMFGLTFGVKYLLGRGYDHHDDIDDKTTIDPYLRVPEGMVSPMSLAASRGHEDVVRTLFDDQLKQMSQGQHDVNPALMRKLTKGPLLAAIKSGHEPVTRFLLGHRGSSNRREDVLNMVIDEASAMNAP